jgi:hypothetical protein
MIVGGGRTGPGFEIVTEPRTAPGVTLTRRALSWVNGTLREISLEPRPDRKFQKGPVVRGVPGRANRGFPVRRRRIFHSHRTIWRWGFGWRTRRPKNLLCNRSPTPPEVRRLGDPLRASAPPDPVRHRRFFFIKRKSVLVAGTAAFFHQAPATTFPARAGSPATISFTFFAAFSVRVTMGNLLILCLYITKVVMYCQFRR